MHRSLLTTALVIVTVALVSTTAEAHYWPTGWSAASRAVTITFTFTDGPGQIVVRYDGRQWRMMSAPWSTDPSERCMWKLNAQRVVDHRHLLKGVPRSCLSRWERRHVHPDRAPR